MIRLLTIALLIALGFRLVNRLLAQATRQRPDPRRAEEAEYEILEDEDDPADTPR